MAFFEAQVHCYCPVGFHRRLQSDLYIIRRQSSNSLTSSNRISPAAHASVVFVNKVGGWERVTVQTGSFLNKCHEDLIHFFYWTGGVRNVYGIICGTSTMLFPCGASQMVTKWHFHQKGPKLKPVQTSLNRFSPAEHAGFHYICTCALPILDQPLKSCTCLFWHPRDACHCM